MEAMELHPQKFYLKWGTDINIFTPNFITKERLTFFHSSGMCARKGTDILVNAFINGELFKNANLVIHTQSPIIEKINVEAETLSKYNITVIEKTVPAPGLYYLGDVYVYPTRVDGLGLTIYEALASGLPVITTDYPPMNEAIDNSVGKLVKVARNYSRADAYYWPMSICDEKDLIEKMQWYIDHPDELEDQKSRAREKAINEYDFRDRAELLSDIMTKSKIRSFDESLYNDVIWHYNKERIKSPYLFFANSTIFNTFKRLIDKKHKPEKMYKY